MSRLVGALSLLALAAGLVVSRMAPSGSRAELLYVAALVLAFAHISLSRGMA